MRPTFRTVTPSVPLGSKLRSAPEITLKLLVTPISASSTARFLRFKTPSPCSMFFRSSSVNDLGPCGNCVSWKIIVGLFLEKPVKESTKRRHVPALLTWSSLPPLECSLCTYTGRCSASPPPLKGRDGTSITSGSPVLSCIRWEGSGGMWTRMGSCGEPTSARRFYKAIVGVRFRPNIGYWNFLLTLSSKATVRSGTGTGMIMGGCGSMARCSPCGMLSARDSAAFLCAGLMPCAVIRNVFPWIPALFSIIWLL